MRKKNEFLVIKITIAITEMTRSYSTIHQTKMKKKLNI